MSLINTGEDKVAQILLLEKWRHGFLSVIVESSLVYSIQLASTGKDDPILENKDLI